MRKSPPKRNADRRQGDRITRSQRTIFVTLFVLLAAVAVAASGAIFSGSLRKADAAPQEADVSPEALAQIDALIAEKESRTPRERKMDSQLIYELKMDRGQSIAEG